MKTELSLSTLQGQGVFKGSALPSSSEVTRKTYTTSNVTTIDDEERSFSTIMSTGNEDREGEVVVMGGMDTKEYDKNPVLCWGHIYSTPPVGKAMEVVAIENGLAGKFKMASTPFANDLWTLVKDGMLNAVSIGFIRLQTYKRGAPGFIEACKQSGVAITATLSRITTKAVLVETSLVCTPCNRDAIMFAVASKGLLEAANRLGVDVQSDDDAGDMIVTKAVSLGTKPYPTEHAARQESPDAFVKFRRVNNAFGEGIHAIYGIDAQGKTHVQTIRFDVTKYTVAESKTWLNDHGYEATVEAAVPQKQEAAVTEPTDIPAPVETPAVEPIEPQVKTTEAPVEPPVESTVESTVEPPVEVPAKVVEPAEVPVEAPEAPVKEVEPMVDPPVEPTIVEQAEAAIAVTQETPATEAPVEPKPVIKVIRIGPKPTVKVLRLGGYTYGTADFQIAKSLNSGKVL
jgi:HK97 family phage prohead protease